MFNPAVRGFRWLAGVLARFGALDAGRGREIADLAWPRFLTMIARFSLRASDVAMVGLAVGTAGIAGITFATVFWQVAFAFGIGIAGGTIGLVAQRYSAKRSERASQVIARSALLGVAITVPFVVAYWLWAEQLVGLFTRDPETVRYGATYLRTSAVALVFVTLNVVAGRALAGADDTWIPMSIRASGAVVNVALNATLIFGLNLGVFGAALGSVLAEGLVTLCFAWGFLRGRVPVIGEFPVAVSFGRETLDPGGVRTLVRTSTPLVGQRLGMVVVRFPLLAVLAGIGPAVPAAFEVARRVRNLLNAFGAGFSMSASSLVGQALGRSDERKAVAYGRDTLAFSVVVYVASAVLVFALAPGIARLFGGDPETVALTTPFVRAAAVSFVGLGAFRTFEGILKGAGDNRWTMYGRVSGLYLLLLPVAYLGAHTSLGLPAVFAGLIAETWGAALLTGYRVRSGKWTVASRAVRPSSASD